MPRLERPRFAENVEPGPVARIVAAAAEESGERVARRFELAGAAADRVRAHQRGGCLAERAGLHFLAEVGNPARFVQHDVDPRPGCRTKASGCSTLACGRSSRRGAGSKRPGAGYRDCRAQSSPAGYRCGRRGAHPLLERLDRSGAAPAGSRRSVLEQHTLLGQLGADAVGLGEVALLLGGGAGGDQRVDPLVAGALEPGAGAAAEQAEQRRRWPSGSGHGRSPTAATAPAAC